MSDIFIVQENPDNEVGAPRPPRKFRGPSPQERYGDNNAGDPTAPRQTIVVTNAIARLAPPPNALSATVSIETNGARYTVDGTNPTAAIGTLIAAGGTVKVMGRASLLGFAMFRSGAADATAQVEYFN